jgi:inner membrane protein YhjD
MAWMTSPRVAALRRRRASVDAVLEAIDGWRRHLTGRNAAMLTYYGFLSVFPLLLAATTILGFVLQHDPELRREIVKTAIAQIPVVGRDLVEDTGAVGGGVWGLVAGLLVALWAATKAFVGVQDAFDDTWEVPLDRRGSLALRRGKALLGIAMIGTSFAATVVLTAVASIADLRVLSRVLLLAGTVAVNTLVLAAMYRFLSAHRVRWPMVWPGAILGGVGFTALQVLGATIVRSFLKSAGASSAAFAAVFALMAWISLHVAVSLAGAELNAALERRRSGRR